MNKTISLKKYSGIFNSKRDYILGFIIQIFSYYISTLVKRGNLYFNKGDGYFVIMLMGVTFIFALLTEKYKPETQKLPPHAIFKAYFNSFVLSLGLISIIVSLFFNENSSRLIVFGSLVLSFFIEIAIFTLKYKLSAGQLLNLSYDISILNLVVELLLLAVSFFAASLITETKAPPFNSYPFIYGTSFIVWLTFSLTIHNFKSITYKPAFWPYIWKRIKTYVFFACAYSFILYAYNVNPKLILHSHIFLLLYSTSAILVFNLFYIFTKAPRQDEIKGSLRSIVEYKENINLSAVEFIDKCSAPNPGNNHPYLKEQLENVYLKKYPFFFEFLNRSLHLSSFDFRKCVMIRSSDLYNVEIIPESYLEFYMNLHEINDIPNINDYFRKLNDRLIKGGYFAGRVEPTHLRFERFLHRYPYHLARLFYFFDFLWRRATPNLPVVRKIYYAFSNGKKRAISFPEALGRLYYCGFEICNYETSENFIYFVAKKISEPDTKGNPLYGPLIKLKRVGKGGKIFNVYKLRTMHPYSEFIQKYVYEKNQLAEGGKIKNDFRVTSWGKVFRKYWLDELPMFINLLRGDLKIVGVRPISAHYLSLYSEELRQLRFKYKPGILPPFYYDLPKTLDEIIASEIKYLTEYSKNPVKTDFKYFFKIIANILLKKARSN